MGQVKAGLSCKSMLNPVSLTPYLYFLVSGGSFKLSGDVAERKPFLVCFFRLEIPSTHHESPKLLQKIGDAHLSNTLVHVCIIDRPRLLFQHVVQFIRGCKSHPGKVNKVIFASHLFLRPI